MESINLLSAFFTGTGTNDTKIYKELKMMICNLKYFRYAEFNKTFAI